MASSRPLETGVSLSASRTSGSVEISRAPRIVFRMSFGRRDKRSEGLKGMVAFFLTASSAMAFEKSNDSGSKEEVLLWTAEFPDTALNTTKVVEDVGDVIVTEEAVPVLEEA